MTGTANHWKESLAKNSQAHFLFLTCQSKLTKVTLAPIIKVFEKKQRKVVPTPLIVLRALKI